MLFYQTVGYFKLKSTEVLWVMNIVMDNRSTVWEVVVVGVLVVVVVVVAQVAVIEVVVVVAVIV